MKLPRLRLRQRGAALFAMAAILGLGGTWYMVSRVSERSVGYAAEQQRHNAMVLNQAKQALIGWVAQQAAKAETSQYSGEDNPGRLPCPEGTAYIGVDGAEGTTAPGLMNVSSGTYSAPTCYSIGRFPWRSLGMDKLVDAAGEPLWYVVGPTWRLTTSSSSLKINSDTQGDITYNGSNVIALVIAPGAALNAQTATGCTAYSQARTTPSSSINASDYLECFNSATLVFTPNTSSTVSNDQVVAITAADIMPVLEAAIAKRIEQDIVPVLKAVYTSSTWNRTAANPLLPFAATFASPGTSGFRGVAATYQGLLPFSYTASSCGTDARCSTYDTSGFTVNNSAVLPTLTRTAGTGTWTPTTPCTLNVNLRARCNGNYRNNGTPNTANTIRMTVNVKNAAMALRDLDQTKLYAEYRQGSSGSYSQIVCANCLTAAFKSDGTADVYADVTLPLSPSTTTWYFRINIGNYPSYTTNNSPLKDHAILSSSDATTGWFVRNEWYKLVYYAVASGNTATGLPTPACTTGSSCLTVTNLSPSNNKRALLILAGRSLNGTSRPNGTLTDYLEIPNRDGDTTFAKQNITRSTFNDRIVVLDSN